MGVKVREKPPGSGVWWIFINHHGRRRAKKVGTDEKLARDMARKTEARLVLGDLDLDAENGSRIPTLKQYVNGWKEGDGTLNPGWLDKYARLALKRSTCDSYEKLLNGHILPELGSLPLNQITSRLVGDLIVKKFKQGLRSQSIKNIKNCLSSILRYAHRPDGYIEGNPARGIHVPKPELEVPKREPDPLTWEDRQVLEDCFQEHFPKYYPLVLAGFRTGLRIGELIGLQWQDIDFRHRLIYVSRNVSRGKVTTPKSRSGVRQVRMTSQLAEELEALLTGRKEEKLKRGWTEVPAWVFCNEQGGYLNYYNFIPRVWNRAMEKSKLRRRTPHDMRHTYATLRLSKGDSLAEVSKEMGHSTPDITYRTYYKWLPKESRTDIDELDNPQPSATYTQPTKEEGANHVG
ncbi:MAG: site-specific integrase [Proteobacteria bacterium]|nr:site-specific integrase [Pseudomonadota bacterium]